VYEPPFIAIVLELETFVSIVCMYSLYEVF